MIQDPGSPGHHWLRQDSGISRVWVPVSGSPSWVPGLGSRVPGPRVPGSWVLGPNRPGLGRFEDLNKDIFLEVPNHKHVVKYDVYLDILLMGYIYVI